MSNNIETVDQSNGSSVLKRITMGMFTKGDGNYFELFEKGISISTRAAEQLVSAFKDDVIDASEMQKIKEIEHEGDRLVHHSLKMIEDAFITPIDRSDIVEVVKGIEDITDSIDAVANHIYIMRVNKADCYMRKMVDLLVNACKELNELMTYLPKFKKNMTKINELIVDINRLEEEGDRTFAEGMLNLFSPKNDAITIIKNKELYERLEDALDRCEDVADNIEKIMVSKT